MTPESQPQISNRWHYLDVARAIAATCVIVQHTLERYSKEFYVFGENHFNLGMFGVTLFFLASGTIIPPSIHRSGVRGFWIARIFRLFPLYWVSIAIAACLWRGAFSWKIILVNLTMLQEYFHVRHIQGTYWTLSVEMLFYGLCTIILAFPLLKRINPSNFVAIALAGFFVISLGSLLSGIAIPLGRLQMIVASFVGIYFSSLCKLPRRPFRIMLVVALFSCLIFAALVRFSLVPGKHLPDEPKLSFACTSISWLSAYALYFYLYSIRNHNFPKSVLKIGSVCYATYLLHPFVIGQIPKQWNPVLQIALVLSITNIAGVISWKYFESPMIKLGKRINKQFADTSMDAAAISDRKK